MSDQSTTAQAVDSVVDVTPAGAPGQGPGPEGEVRHLSVAQYPTALRVADKLRRVVDFVGRIGSWLIVPLVLITTLDIVARKLIWHNAAGEAVGMQIWLVATFGRIFESTILQELEWHFHTALWAAVLGYGYIWNTQVRVDLVREHLKFRKQAWIELIGVTLFLIPYCVIVVWFAVEYAVDSFKIGEISASQVGLPMRWIIKSVIAAGLILAVVAGIAVWLQVVLVLFGPQNVRFPLMTLDWPEEAGTKLEGKERLELAKVEGVLEQKAREWEEKKLAGPGADALPEEEAPTERKKTTT